MRPVSRAVAAGAVLCLVVACSGPPASSSAIDSPSPSPSPSPSTAVALPSAAPSSPPTASPMPTQRTIQSPDPSFSRVDIVCELDGSGCALERTNEAGVLAEGWPIDLDGPIVENTWNDFTIGCGRTAERILRAGVDDLTFVAVEGPAGPELHAYESWGLPAPGWPRPLPAPDGECHGFMLSGSGDHILAWGYEGVEQDIELIADRTAFTMFDLRGRTVPGWPRGSEGAASGPVTVADGIAYVSATGRVWAHDGGGDVRPGWGYRLTSKEAPLAFGDHLAFVQPAADADDAVVVLGADGQPLSGYPAALDGRVESRCLFGDTPCVGHVGPGLAPDGTVYVALGNGRPEVAEGDPTGGRIEAMGPDGRVVDGWPVQLPDWSHVTRLGWSSEGGVVATVVVCEPVGCHEVDHVEEHWYGMDGRLVQVLPVDGDTMG